MAVTKLSEEQREQVIRIKNWRPYLIAYGALNPETGEFIAASVATMRIPNRLARAGWHVEVIGKTHHKRTSALKQEPSDEDN